MQTLIVRIYRRYPEDKGLVSGVVEDTESDHKVAFQNFDDLQSLLAYSIECGQLSPSGNVPGKEDCIS